MENNLNTETFPANPSGMDILGFEVTPEETEKLNHLVDYFEKATDLEIVANIEELRANAPDMVKKLKGVRQAKQHGGIDAFDHTFNTFLFLNTVGLSSGAKVVVRMTMLLHDVAKMYDPMDAEHPRSSALMAEKLLAQTKLSDFQKEDIQEQIAHHDYLGEISRQSKRKKRFTRSQLGELFTNRDQVNLHRLVVMADVSSIPGLRKFLPNIEKTYAKVKDKV